MSEAGKKPYDCFRQLIRVSSYLLSVLLSVIPYRMKVRTEFNLATWRRLVILRELNIIHYIIYYIFLYFIKAIIARFLKVK